MSTQIKIVFHSFTSHLFSLHFSWLLSKDHCSGISVEALVKGVDIFSYTSRKPNLPTSWVYFSWNSEKIYIFNCGILVVIVIIALCAETDTLKYFSIPVFCGEFSPLKYMIRLKCLRQIRMGLLPSSPILQIMCAMSFFNWVCCHKTVTVCPWNLNQASSIVKHQIKVRLL